MKTNASTSSCATVEDQGSSNPQSQLLAGKERGVLTVYRESSKRCCLLFNIANEAVAFRWAGKIHPFGPCFEVRMAGLKSIH